MTLFLTINYTSDNEERESGPRSGVYTKGSKSPLLSEFQHGIQFKEVLHDNQNCYIIPVSSAFPLSLLL